MIDVAFEFCLKPTQVEKDLIQYPEAASLGIEELQEIADGHFLVLFPKVNQYMKFKVELIIYLIKLRKSIVSLDTVHSSSFVVSGDYYNGSISLTRITEHDLVVIEDTNAGFKVAVEYSRFKTGFVEFFVQFLKEMLKFYPGLKDNPIFREAWMLDAGELPE